jgi:hypothetical protein
MSENVKHLPIPQAAQQTSLTTIESFDELVQRSEFFAKSALIPTSLRGKPADVAIILQMGVEVGIGPMQALNGIEVIQGRPTVKPEMMLALIKARVPEAYIKIEVDPVKTIATCTMAPSRDRLDESFTSVWDMPRAVKAGLANKDNYKSQPLVMLKWRAVGEAARTVFSHLTRGIYAEEEMAYHDPSQSQDKGKEITDAIRASQMAAQQPQASSITPVPPPVIEAEHRKVEELPKEPVEPAFDPLGDYVAKVGKGWSDTSSKNSTLDR